MVLKDTESDIIKEVIKRFLQIYVKFIIFLSIRVIYGFLVFVCPLVVIFLLLGITVTLVTYLLGGDIMQVIIAFCVGFCASCAASWYMATRYFKTRSKKKYEEAIRVFADRLGHQIKKATMASRSDLYVQARALVSMRNEMRGTLSELQSYLNSDIDRLERDLKSYQKSGDTQELQASIAETLSVLSEKWPAKQEQLSYAVRKLLVDLGLVES